jgi:hypothetical protein
VSNLRDNEVDTFDFFFQPEKHGKIKMNCLDGYIDKQIGMDLQLSYKDLVQ